MPAKGKPPTPDPPAKPFSFPQRVPDHKWLAYFDGLKAGLSRSQASAQAGISLRTADTLHANPTKSSGWHLYKEWLDANPRDVVPRHKMSPNAKQALKDFGVFRERYFGHISRPWHVEAAETMVKLLEADEKSFVVVNCPPGSGKTTLFSHDLVCWLLARDRSIRCMIGTGAENTGQDYTIRVRTSLERIIPIDADETEKRRGLAKDAATCLVHDFGRFKPEGSAYWRANKLVVAREGGAPAHQKEASVVSYGRQSSFLGGRYNIVIWDDVVTDQNSQDYDDQEKLARWWRNTAESRLEPGGVLILQGQRLSATDLYRHVLDLRDITAAFDGNYDDDDVDFDPDDLPRKYIHIVYKAHDDEKCKGGRHDAPNHHPDTAPAWPKGCLLDPRRLTYKDLMIAKFNDSRNYATVYQQEDSDPDSVLVNPIWINGGQDKNGTIYPGCWDTDRMLGEFPKNLKGDVYSVVTADPSAANFWGLMWWGFQVETQFQHLIDMRRQRMTAPQLLDWQHSEGAWTGLLEEWWQQSKEIGRPITHVIVETNACQRFLLQYDHARRWAAARSVDLVSHSTQRNKTDRDLGVPALGPHYRFGRVRLPGHNLTKPEVLPLYREVTRYPQSATNDLVMAHWFLICQSANLFIQKNVAPPQFSRPTWIRSRSRGVA